MPTLAIPLYPPSKGEMDQPFKILFISRIVNPVNFRISSADIVLSSFFNRKERGERKGYEENFVPLLSYGASFASFFSSRFIYKCVM
jgi:hypothetical protein